MLDYLTNRKQGTKIGSAFSSWYDTNTDIPQGSFLGPLFFNTLINNLFFSIAVATIQLQSTPYSCNKNL